MYSCGTYVDQPSPAETTSFHIFLEGIEQCLWQLNSEWWLTVYI